MQESEKRRISELKEEIFLLQIEEGRLGPLLKSPIKSEDLKARATQALKVARGYACNSDRRAYEPR